MSQPAAIEYDRDGNVVGRRLPFTLAPLGRVWVQQAVIPLLQGASCAERLWSITAAIQTVHGRDPFIGAQKQSVTLEVRKANSFYSQWCNADNTVGAGYDDFQQALYRPSLNPFTEATAGSGTIDDTASRALIRAFVNVDARGFANQEYAADASAELAGRGLFGQYELFIPEAALGTLAASERGERDGLDLSVVEDIELRRTRVGRAAAARKGLSQRNRRLRPRPDDGLRDQGARQHERLWGVRQHLRSGPDCSDGTCKQPPCAVGTMDCDGDRPSNGCEVAIASDTSNCGGCGITCTADVGQHCVLRGGQLRDGV